MGGHYMKKQPKIVKKQPRLAKPYVWPTWEELEAKAGINDSRVNPVEEQWKERDDNLA